MRAILKQLKFELKRFYAQKNSIQTLFIGGGTPSTIQPHLYEPFFETIKPFMAKDAEITTEANPNSASKIWLESMKNLGVNRISFGVQSFDNKKLKFLGRNHTAKMAIDALTDASIAGFKNISLDLIYGTSQDSKKLLIDDLEIAFSLPINHLSAYSLTLEEKTPFFSTPNVQNDDENLAYFFTKEIVKRGLPQYEISNFGRVKSKHNLGYWKYENYIGIGCGGVGFLNESRFYTQTDINSYIKEPMKIRQELLNEKSMKSEKVLLGCRSEVGFSKDILTHKELEKAMHLVDAKKLFLKNGYLFNPNYFLSDEIALYIL